MNINPISNNAKNQTAFKGKIIPKIIIGSAYEKKFLDEALKHSENIRELANEGYDVVGRLSRKIRITPPDHIVYKIKVSLLKENSFFDKVKDFFGLIPRISVTRRYHPTYIIRDRMQDKGIIDTIKNGFTNIVGKK